MFDSLGTFSLTIDWEAPSDRPIIRRGKTLRRHMRTLPTSST